MQYKIIYMFHMPMFVFLSGLFLNSVKDCFRQIKKILPIYVLCQLLMFLCGKVSKIETPWWILWYLLSYCFWSLFGILWFAFFVRWTSFVNKIKELSYILNTYKEKKTSSFFDRNTIKYIMLFIVIIIGASAGNFSNLNRTWSASRTIVFFPYFFAGLVCKPDMIWEKYKTWGKVALAVAICGMLIWGEKIQVTFLYHAEGFSVYKFPSIDCCAKISCFLWEGINLRELICEIFEHPSGFILRIVCYGIGALLSFFLLTNISGDRFPFTKAGADTMPIYLLHAPFVLLIRTWELPWICYIGWSLFFIYFVYKIFQWNGVLFGIIPIPRRKRSVSKNIRKA